MGFGVFKLALQLAYFFFKVFDFVGTSGSDDADAGGGLVNKIDSFIW